MTQNREQIDKIAELNSIFMTLNDEAQEGALIVLRSLEFAQSVMAKPNVSPQNAS